MLKSKDVARKSETFLANLERSGFNYDPTELIGMDQLLDSGKSECEFCIE